MGLFGSRPTKTLAAMAVVGGLGTGAAHPAASGPVAGLWDSLREHFGWSGGTCAAASIACLESRAGSLRQRRAEVREARAQAEAGLRAVEAEEKRVRDLLDANLGHQVLLRSRVNDAILRGAERVSFLGRTYAMGEAAAQAAALVAEQQQFESVLSGMLPSRREALMKVRVQGMQAENTIATTLATLDADRALLLADRSMARVSQLLTEMTGAEQKANEVLGTVRSTVELVAAERPVAPPSGAAPTAASFDFNAWRSARPSQGG